VEKVAPGYYPSHATDCLLTLGEYVVERITPWLTPDGCFALESGRCHGVEGYGSKHHFSAILPRNIHLFYKDISVAMIYIKPY